MIRLLQFSCLLLDELHQFPQRLEDPRLPARCVLHLPPPQRAAVGPRQVRLPPDADDESVALRTRGQPSTPYDLGPNFPPQGRSDFEVPVPSALKLEGGDVGVVTGRVAGEGAGAVEEDGGAGRAVEAALWPGLRAAPHRHAEPGQQIARGV